jgi:hypothetical protein
MTAFNAPCKSMLMAGLLWKLLLQLTIRMSHGLDNVFFTMP